MGLALLLSPGLIPESESHPRVSRGDNTTGYTAWRLPVRTRVLLLHYYGVSRRYQLVLRENKNVYEMFKVGLREISKYKYEKLSH